MDAKGLLEFTSLLSNFTTIVALAVKGDSTTKREELGSFCVGKRSCKLALFMGAGRATSRQMAEQTFC